MLDRCSKGHPMHELGLCDGMEACGPRRAPPLESRELLQLLLSGCGVHHTRTPPSAHHHTHTPHHPNPQHDTALALLMQHLAAVKLEKEEEAWKLSSQLKAVNATLRASLARQQELADELVCCVRAVVRRMDGSMVDDWARTVDMSHPGVLLAALHIPAPFFLSMIHHHDGRSCAWGRSTS